MNTPHARRSAAARWALRTALTITAATVSIILAMWLTDQAKIRLDVTATRAHQLAPQTSRILDLLDQPVRCVIAGPISTLDRRAVDAARTVLDRMERASQNLTHTFIDTASSQGPGDFDQLIDQLVDRDKSPIAEQTQAILIAADTLLQAGTALQNLAPSLSSIALNLPAQTPNADNLRKYFRQRASLLRVTSENLTAASASAKEQFLDTTQKLPPLIEAKTSLTRGLSETISALNQLAHDLNEFSQAEGMNETSTSSAASITDQLLQVHDALASTSDQLQLFEPVDVLRVASALESQSAVLIIGPAGTPLAAISFDRIFPPARLIDAAGGARADLTQNAERLIAIGLSAIASPINPTVIIVHGEPRPFFDEAPGFQQLFEHAAQKRFDLKEWAVAANPPMPQPQPTTPNSPVVFIVIPTSVDAASTQDSASGVKRTAALATTLTTLLDAGENVLLSLTPSPLSALGQPDPIAQAIEPLGILADTARPLLHMDVTSGTSRVEPDWQLLAAPGDNPIAQAIANLQTYFPWPVPMRATGSDNSTWVLYQIPAGAGWAESDWQTLYRTPRQYRSLMESSPTPDSDADDTQGPWPVAMAVQRSMPGAAPQRLITIGASGWFFDRIAQNQRLIDNRAARTWPGNLELFDASIRWLAHQDELIARSITTQAIPMIRAIEPRKLSLIRFLLIAGLPLLVLIIGLMLKITHR